MRKWTCNITDDVACDKAFRHSNDGFKAHVQTVHVLEWPRHGRTLYGLKIDAPPLAPVVAPEPLRPSDVPLGEAIGRLQVLVEHNCVAQASFLILLRVARRLGEDIPELETLISSLKEPSTETVVEPADIPANLRSTRPSSKKGPAAKKAKK
ncbi:hypothetical protein H257_18252 [Aphanomyces astaci]|uniref:Uncharacterized protein n=1 Tax=Aphanomyces astaci TaxID=112090 RepID=W4FDN9_APHAT|nr:hypothetical protein H257_18252 [Aphanomyces astaci]ETV64956.1 hypothetical protein H257_18252 [Aphanomyces astaci]|eukprot:XP_009845580.1 hypothetical protein H257_18252 [Aphanomyces astaci]